MLRPIAISLEAEADGGASAPFAADIAACIAEVAALRAYLNESCWDERAGTYADRRLRAPAGLSSVRTVGAYWTLLAGAVPAARLPPLLAALDDPAAFNRPLRVPSLSARDPRYRGDGGYWLGGVWPPTTYMVLRGLSSVRADDVAADIGRNYNEGVARCFAATGTLHENMAPELAPGAARGAAPVPGNPAKPDFVGWAVLGPIAVLIEYVFGLRPHAQPAGVSDSSYVTYARPSGVTVASTMRPTSCVGSCSTRTGRPASFIARRSRTLSR